MKKGNIKVFYNTKQVLAQDSTANVSKSPLKPKLLLEFMKKQGLKKFEITDDFTPYEKQDFLVAHSDHYVNGFFEGKETICRSNGLAWSPQFADSVRYTNASLYNAIKHSVENPETICFSPTSGFHHARPDGGSGFCTFSGQVIAAVKLYQEKGISGCFLDLDGHFGNSIEDSRAFVKDLNAAIPVGFNFNPFGSHKEYVNHLKTFLKETLEPAIISGKISYVVWCHGADSHEWDDMGHQCSTEEWLLCSKIFYSWLKRVEKRLLRSVPLSLSLFGGYRRDGYESVLALHAGDISTCMNILLGSECKVKRFVGMVKPATKYNYYNNWTSRRDVKHEEDKSDDLLEDSALFDDLLDNPTYVLTSRAFTALVEPNDEDQELLETLSILECYNKLYRSSFEDLGITDDDLKLLIDEGYVMQSAN